MTIDQRMAENVAAIIGNLTLENARVRAELADLKERMVQLQQALAKAAGEKRKQMELVKTEPSSAGTDNAGAA